MANPGEISTQLERAVGEENWARTLLLAKELLFGEVGMSTPNSPVAIAALASAHRAGYRPAGYELARLPFEVLEGRVELTETEWLELMIENARSGDMGAIIDIEHLPERLLPREYAMEIARTGRAARPSNVSELR